MTRIAVVVVGVLAAAAAADAQSWRDRPLSQPVTVLDPVEGRDPLAIAYQIGRFGRVPIGFEEIAPAPPPLTRTPRERRELDALTVGEALDRLKALDPRYDIRETGGAIVIRPTAAWADPHDPLNQPVVGLSLARMTPEDALQYVHARLYGMKFTRSAQAVSRLGEPFLLRVDSGSILDILDETLKASGQLMWFVRYRSPVGDVDDPTLRFSVCLQSFDGVGACRANPGVPLSIRTPGR